MSENAIKQVALSILELASVAAGRPIGSTFKHSLELAQRAEELGYKRFWLAEHHNMKSIASTATPVLMAHIAGGTQKIRVGSGGIMLPNHSPLVVSEQFGTLAHLFPGRIDMGLGRAPGTDQETAHAIRSDRNRSVFRFPEEVAQIQHYFSDQNEGESVRSFISEGMDVPQYILGSSTDSAHVAAKMGLPYAFASHFAPAQLFQALQIYREEFQPSAQLQQPYTIAGVNIIAADTDAEAERLSTSMLYMIIGVLTGKMDYMRPPVEMTDELREVAQSPALQRMLHYAFVGSKATVKSKITQFLDQAGVDELMVVSHVYDPEARIRSYEIVAEILKEL